MKPNTIHNQLLDAIKDRIPSDNSIVGRLMDILCIGKEAIYRRLRGEVSFTLEETATIALQLGISLDDIVGTSSHPNSRPFQLKTTTFVDPSDSDYYQMNEWIGVLRKIVQAPDLEMGSVGNVLDLVFIYSHPHLSKFYHFKWQYQWRSKDGVKHFKEIEIPEKHQKLQLEHAKLSKEVRKSYYIWDYMIFKYIVNDIVYFRNIRLIDDDDVLNIKQDLISLINEIESIARKGCFETGNSVQLYISEINTNASYLYYQSVFFNLTLINAFIFNGLASTDLRATNEIKELILSQKRHATLISESGEMQRMKFFTKQREIIDAL